MRFKEFLRESKYKTEVEIDEVEKLLEENCKDAMKLFHRPLWRGMSGNSDAYVIHGESGGRKSANTSNFYTVILDKFLPYFGYPKRSESIICANDENKSYAGSFGTVYALFPYDGVPIGVCQDHDLWETTPFRVGKNPDRRSIQSWNRFYSSYDLDPHSWEDFKFSLENAMEDDTSQGKELLEWFGPPENIDAVFRKAYNPETLFMELSNSDNIDKIRGPRELWFSGKCVAIKRDVYMRMLEEKGLAP